MRLPMNRSQILLAAVFLAVTGTFAAAQTPAAAGQPAPMTNLLVIPKDTPRSQVLAQMQAIAGSLGVQCNYCHVMEGRGGRNDMASDDKATKKAARGMMMLT